MKLLAFSLRPLLLEELAEIFILDPEKSPPLDEDDRLFPAKAVLKYLPGLVTEVAVFCNEIESVRYEINVTEIRFAHFSIKEYLSSDRMADSYFSTRDPDASHLYIAESCLAYHLHFSETVLVNEKILLQYPLWEYAIKHGLIHLEKVPRGCWTASTTDRVNRGFTAESQACLNQIRIYEGTFEGEIFSTPLYYASNMKLLHLASYLIENEADVNEVSPGSLFGTALGVAAKRGYENIVKLLLDHHASIDANIGDYGTASQAAAEYGRLEVVQLLLNRGANVNVQGGYYGSALQAAAVKGSLEVVQLLLNSGANVNTEGGEYGSALPAAAACAHPEVVQLLLGHDANINAEGGGHGNALQVAALYGHIEVVQLLLDRGANPKAKGGPYGNALQAAIACDESNSPGIAKLLLSLDAKVDPPGEEWEKLLEIVAKGYEGFEKSERLREFQRDPDGYIERKEREKRGQPWR